jgi:hypothetical protein
MASAKGPGRFLGLHRAATRSDAESLFNIARWGNSAEGLRTYELTRDLTIYYGRVAGGSGRQGLIPSGVNPT